MNRSSLVWKLLFWGIVIAYCLFYAPFGVNETDGGFLTGLAWQVLSGKQLYVDIIYVRPPLPIWLRSLEIYFLPESWAVLGERWIFYFKIALYSWLGASILTQGEKRWILAIFGFVISTHCYPAMAWHSVDGIMFGVLAAFFLHKGTKIGLVLAGVSLFGALLCKQSFYPLLPLFGLLLGMEKERRWDNFIYFMGPLLLCYGLFFKYLNQCGALQGFQEMTNGAASGGQALEHGLLDYFRITPELSLPGIFLLSPVIWWFWKGQNQKLAALSWSIWIMALVLSFAAITWLRQEHTVPFAQSRAMFWVAIGYGIWLLLPKNNHAQPILKSLLSHRSWILLMGISWCASVSWGYNLPILFATPWVWAGMEVNRSISNGAQSSKFVAISRFALLLGLLLAFRVGYEFVYRDGPRSEMNASMGSIFPALSGIYTDQETAGLYLNLQRLVGKYGQNFKTLPAFPQANFLTKTDPPLPLDWVVNRETNGDNDLVFKRLNEQTPVVFIQKSFKEKIDSDPELMVTKQALTSGKLLEETPYFWVVQWVQKD